MKMLRLIASAALALALATPTFAGVGTITTKDAAGVTRTFVVTTDGSGNFVSQTVICDQSAAANCATVSGNALSVAATLSAETTKAIGVVRNSDGSGNLLTSTANALDINIKSGSIANTSFAATQTTAANLNATVVGTGTFAVQAASTLTAETTKVIGTVRNVGNVGGVFDAVRGAGLPANAVAFGGSDGTNLVTPLVGAQSNVASAAGMLATLGICQYNATPPTITTTRFNNLQCDINGNLMVAGVGVGDNVSLSGLTGTPIGGLAQSAERSALTAGRFGFAAMDLAGKLINLPYANPENFVQGAITSAMTGTTSTSLIAAPASGLRNYITACTFSNAHATVGTDIVIQDGNGGTTIWTAPAAAVYGGAHLTFPVPLRQPTTATAVYVQNVTTGASTKASCNGYKGA